MEVNHRLLHDDRDSDAMARFLGSQVIQSVID
jgi:hypothetical protein